MQFEVVLSEVLPAMASLVVMSGGICNHDAYTWKCSSDFFTKNLLQLQNLATYPSQSHAECNIILCNYLDTYKILLHHNIIIYIYVSQLHAVAGHREPTG